MHLRGLDEQLHHGLIENTSVKGLDECLSCEDGMKCTLMMKSLATNREHEKAICIVCVVWQTASRESTALDGKKPLYEKTLFLAKKPF